MNDKLKSLSKAALEELGQGASSQLRRYALDHVNSASALAALDEYSILNRYIASNVNSAYAAFKAHKELEEGRASSLIRQLAGQSSAQRMYDEVMGGGIRAADLMALRDPVSMVTRDLNFVRDYFDKYEDRFIRPDLGKLSALFRVDNHVTDIARGYALQGEGIRRSIEAMRSPWLDTANELSSVHGLATLHGIGSAVNSLAGFDDGLSTSLRRDLGDWRDQVTFPDDVFEEVAARSEFYIGQGLNLSLTDFPASAFHEGLEIAHLSDELPPEVTAFLSPETEGEVDHGEQRNTAAYRQILRMETHLREFINRLMAHHFGSDWPRTRLPDARTYESWQWKKRKAEEEGAPQLPLIAYADFKDYGPLILHEGNWIVFSKTFRRQESLRESLQRLQPLRIAVMHSRVISQDDQLYLYVEVKRLIQAISSAQN